MRTGWAMLAGGALIAASILFIGRYEISAVGYASGSDNSGVEAVYRLDRWTGAILECHPENDAQRIRDSMSKDGSMLVNCFVPDRVIQTWRNFKPSQ